MTNQSLLELAKTLATLTAADAAFVHDLSQVIAKPHIVVRDKPLKTFSGNTEKRRPGRPKGSKNKPKYNATPAMNDFTDEDFRGTQN